MLDLKICRCIFKHQKFCTRFQSNFLHYRLALFLFYQTDKMLQMCSLISGQCQIPVRIPFKSGVIKSVPFRLPTTAGSTSAVEQTDRRTDRPIDLYPEMLRSDGILIIIHPRIIKSRGMTFARPNFTC